MEIKVFNSAVEVSKFMAEEVSLAIKSKPDLSLGLATGRTMDAIYHQLVLKSKEDQIDYSKVKAFAVDEYVGLSSDSENSFRFYLDLHVFNPLRFRKENIYVPRTDLANIDESCLDFEKSISKFGGIDLQLLGLGKNGHIGLNEPGSSIDSRTRVVALTSSTRHSNQALFESESIPNTAVSMGIGTILESKLCYLVATGQTKAEIVQKVVNGDVNSKVPATALKTHKKSYMILDKEAAKYI